MACPVADAAYREHDQHFDQYADNRRERRTGRGSEERDRRRDHELEEIAGADERAGAAIAHLTPNSRIRPHVSDECSSPSFRRADGPLL